MIYLPGTHPLFPVRSSLLLSSHIFLHITRQHRSQNDDSTTFSNPHHAVLVKILPLLLLLLSCFSLVLILRVSAAHCRWE